MHLLQEKFLTVADQFQEKLFLSDLSAVVPFQEFHFQPSLFAEFPLLLYCLRQK